MLNMESRLPFPTPIHISSLNPSVWYNCIEMIWNWQTLLSTSRVFPLTLFVPRYAVFGWQCNLFVETSLTYQLASQVMRNTKNYIPFYHIYPLLRVSSFSQRKVWRSISQKELFTRRLRGRGLCWWSKSTDPPNSHTLGILCKSYIFSCQSFRRRDEWLFIMIGSCMEVRYI